MTNETLEKYDLDHASIVAWLREEDPARLAELWARADAVRKAHVGDAVHLRGLIEISNHCARECGYCGLRAGNRDLERYRMPEDEIIACAHDAKTYQYGTVVLQSGEDYGITAEWMASVIRRIKTETGLAVTLSLGERADEELALWREAGANRYLLRFETSDPDLYRLIHPPLKGRPERSRIEMLRTLQSLGYEAGSGVMVGIPGQTYETLARDIETFRGLDLDMIGIGPYISHPATPLGEGAWRRPIDEHDQAPNTELMTYKAVALTRLACPEANIPSTTALATINTAQGRELGLMRGANIVMPNLTPVKYRALYEIYPAKACINETSGECRTCLTARIRSIGREIGQGPGERKRRSDA
ncbi:MAG TPA: [FeFe] hydrogenase H-cluster radical SAM maturase HydE [Candidatus Hydrogenedentes bacterium]|nr:[FeFe] hydrogenase H-cluster radical SAM maturase HydE [Candidatus Hydrogenedentota bacterium]HOS01439.1 [FeFe] hydrogenase H-cluster radical SAM maturase HydE [Candidatus Hydrogenedentota bacterium]